MTVAATSRSGLVVVDPVQAFTDPAGLIGRLRGADEFRIIVETVDRLAAFAAAHTGPKVWVRAHYSPGQFTDGDLNDPLAWLCTDPHGTDCAWDPQLAPPPDALVVTKTNIDAGTSPAFVQATEAMVGIVDALLVTGFWLTACVAATATSCTERLGSRLPVVVPLSLAATRVGLYDPTDDHPAHVDATIQLTRLQSAGVAVCDTPDTWQNTPPPTPPT